MKLKIFGLELTGSLSEDETFLQQVLTLLLSLLLCQLDSPEAEH